MFFLIKTLDRLYTNTDRLLSPNRQHVDASKKNLIQGFLYELVPRDTKVNELKDKQLGLCSNISTGGVESIGLRTLIKKTLTLKFYCRLA